MMKKPTVKVVERKTAAPAKAPAKVEGGVTLFYGTDVIAVDVPSGLSAFRAWAEEKARAPLPDGTPAPALVFTTHDGAAFLGFEVVVAAGAPVTPTALSGRDGWHRAVLAWVALKTVASAEGIVLPPPTLWILPR